MSPKAFYIVTTISLIGGGVAGYYVYQLLA
ncbi:hypothetical protein JOD17_002240 [Geomicrobium sediminis]|uniref:Uncharacterized protein n=1 Tax=Geomicrobium sediminis TaxID=1347788 RepID=A0ABS2PCS9_9BACL|nr:hypothetical protein [Geomicrobium sediminis]